MTTIITRSRGNEVFRLTVTEHYGDNTYRWISENLLLLRIWWGRYWGADYIFNADTGKIVYEDEFFEPRSSVTR